MHKSRNTGSNTFVDDTPSIRPVNFAFDGERVVIRTGDTVLAEAGERGATAQLEVDEIDPFDHGLERDRHRSRDRRPGRGFAGERPGAAVGAGRPRATRGPDAGVDQRPSSGSRGCRAGRRVAR